MKDKIAEKVMELYGKGVKQNIIAQTLNISPAKVCRIIGKNKADENDFTDEDYEAYAETVKEDAPDENPADDSASENQETPGNSSEDDSDNPDDDPVDEFSPENPETPGNASEDDFPAQMKTIAEMTSVETARRITESYKEVLDLMGSVTREIMENSMSGMDKATRMLLTASERLNDISEKQEKMLASCEGAGINSEHQDSDSSLLYMVMVLLVIFAVFSFGGVCGICDMLYPAVALCGILTAAAVVLLGFYPRSGSRKTFLAFSVIALAAAIPALIAGYFFFLIEKSVMNLWLYALAGVPVGGIISLLHFISGTKPEKEQK